MKKIDKNYTFIILLFVFSGIISWNLYFKKYLQKDTIDIANFPKNINGWVSEDMPLSETDYAILETRNVFVRSYTQAPEKKVYLFIVYSQNNRKVSHPPEICYTGGGATILEHSLDPITVGEQNLLIDSHRLTLERGNDKQIAYYWFKVGDSFTGSYWKQQLLIAVKSIFGKPSSSALIRVSADIKNNDTAKTTGVIKEFSVLISPFLFQYLP